MSDETKLVRVVARIVEPDEASRPVNVRLTGSVGVTLFRAWGLAAVLIGGTFLVANGTDRYAMPALAATIIIQLWALIVTAVALSRRPLAHWHPRLVGLLWLCCAVLWLACVAFGDEMWVAVALLGGGSATGVLLILTWTWLSARADRLKRWSFAGILAIWITTAATGLVLLDAAVNNVNGTLEAHEAQKRALSCDSMKGTSPDSIADFVQCTVRLVNQINRGVYENARADRVLWVARILCLLAFPVALMALMARWIVARRGSADGEVRAWHPLKVVMLWLLLATAAASALLSADTVPRRMDLLWTAALYGSPLFILTWEWLSGRERE